MPDPTPADGTHVNTNAASGQAKVDNQIGYVEGDAVFHKHETIYQVADSDTADRKYRVARNYIEGGNPRFAEDLIGQVLNEGLITTEVAYYYAIAVLSERSLNRLGPNELDKFDHALGIVLQFPHDEWRAAVLVLRDLVKYVVQPADPGTGALQVVLEDFQALAAQRRIEITRHLDMIFDGAVQDELDRLNAQTVAIERAKGDRAGRAWKFFHPDPAAPRRAAPVPLREGRPRSIAWIETVLGFAGFGAFVFFGAEVAFGVLLGPLAVFLLGALIASRYGARVLTVHIRRRMKEFEHTRFPREFDDLDESYLDINVSLKFVRATRKRIDHYFSARRPTTDRDKWNTKTAGIKAALHARVVRLYGAGRVQLPALNWLIRWHAKQAAQQWKKGALPDFRRTLHPELSAVLLLSGGTVVACGGAIWLLATITPAGFPLTAIAIGQIVTGGFGAFGLAYLFGDHQAMTLERQELDELFDAEQEEYQRWSERLSDRPTDSEMANWLDYDKSYLKTLAMRRCGLNNREIIAHVVLTAGKPRANRARVIHGPPRFSKYIVLVFLLTENGVREVEVDLNFLTGAIYDERRTSFRYDALASAEILEEGFQSAEGRQHIVLMGRDVHLTDKSSLVISRTFQLALVNNQTIKVVVDNYDGLLDESIAEDKSQLDNMALDSSGVAVALQILEAVAGEGREWIARERDRRERRWRGWERSRRERAAIAGRPWPLSIETRATTPE
jgi:hypothetical protein